MDYRPLGKTGIDVSRIAFGAGPVAALMTDAARHARQRETIARALELGINWFDTAATYGQGASESCLGRVLAELGAMDRVHVATKVRLDPASPLSLRAQIEQSVEQSLARLGVKRLALLQLHNAITPGREDLPTSLTPQDVLGPGGVYSAFEELRKAGVAAHAGLTGLGQTEALVEVIESNLFQSIQLPVNLLLELFPPAPGASASEPDHRVVIDACARRGMGVFAIRVLAGGALAGHPPSDYTRITRFFTLAQYQRDLERALALRARLPPGLPLEELALRHVLARPGVTSAIIGFADPLQVEHMVRTACLGPLSAASLGLEPSPD